MSKTVENAMYYSWMSQASYLDLANTLPLDDEKIKGALQKKTGFADDKVFAAEQAETFAHHYDFVHQIPNTNWGMSSTAFEDKSNKGNYTIAVRGTEPLSAGDNNLVDILVDLFGVVGEGQAKVQAVQAFHYYKQLTAQPGEVIQYTVQEKTASVGCVSDSVTHRLE